MRRKIFELFLLGKEFTKSYITLEERGEVKIQALLRNGSIFYRKLVKGKITKKQKLEWKNEDYSCITFPCQTYCSDCGCNRW